MMFPTQKLFTEVWAGRLDGVKEALEQGANVNAIDGDSRSPLDYAFKKLIKCVCEHIRNADNSHADIHKETKNIIKERLKRGAENVQCIEKIIIIQELLKKGADPNKKFGAGSYLICAIRMHILELVKELIKHGANIDVIDDHGNTSLELAIETGNLVFVGTLLEAGANVNIQNNYGATPLFNALNDTEMVKMLLQFGADCKATYNGVDCLSLAVQRGKWDIIQELLKHGADTSNLDDLYLSGTIMRGQTAVIKELLKFGVNFSQVFPYHLTVRNRNIDMALQFLKHGVSICTKGRFCLTLLDYIFASAVHSNRDLLSSILLYTKKLIKYAVLVNFLKNPQCVMETKYHYHMVFPEDYCKLQSYYAQCEAELKLMSSLRINESLTLYDVTLKVFTGDESIVECKDILHQILANLKEQFSIYEGVIITAFNKSLLVQKLIEYEVSLSEPSSNTEGKLLVPNIVIEYVADYLSNKDLVNWLWVMEDLHPENTS